MQPPRRPPYQPPHVREQQQQRQRQGGGMPPRQQGRQGERFETQRVMRSPQKEVTQGVWLLQKRRVRPKHVLMVAVSVVVFFCVLLATSARIRTLTAELEIKKAEVRESLIEVAEKERLLQFSGTDEYIEQQARLRYGYLNEGEIRFLPDTSMVNDFGGY